MASLDKKYRPRSFKQFIGNHQTVSTIESLIENSESFPATTLLQGPSGCGKTTLARIIASSLNVNTSNIYELNIADSRRIDDARAIIENLKYSPLTGSGKVIVLNECHKANNEFQNAMLEALEEPPSGVYFLLCTTNPEKLLPTIKTRCTMFNVNSLDRNEIKELIMRVVSKEKKRISPRILRQVGNASEGVPRVALLILNAIINIRSEQKQKEVINNFYIEEDKQIIDLCRVLLKPVGYKQTMRMVSKLEQDPEHIRRTVLKYMSKVLLNNDNSQAFFVMENFLDNFWDSGKAGLIHSVYMSIKNE